MEETSTGITVVMGAVGILQVMLAIYQAWLARRLATETKHAQAKLKAEVEKQGREATALKEELEAKATKEELKRAVGQTVRETVRQTVPEVLQEMAQQYASQGAADQQGSSDADSR